MYAGDDPVTGKRVYRSETIPGTDRAAQRRAEKTPTRLLADDRYDVIWTLTRTADGWRFAQLPELVLPQDQAGVTTTSPVNPCGGWPPDPRCCLTNGGGWGAPFARDPQNVLADVRTST